MVGVFLLSLLLLLVVVSYLNPIGIKAKEIQQQTRINGLFSAYLPITV